MAKPRGTDGSLLSSLLWTLAAIAFSLVPHLQFLPIWITGAFIACGTWRYSIERRRGSVPSIWLRGFLAVVCFLGVQLTFGTISGVGPGSALLAVMAALKLLETRKRRDHFVLLFIAIFLVMSSLLREQYLWSLPYLVLAILLTMTAWLRMSADATEPARKSFATAGRLILYAAPLALAMWVFFPRISTPFWAIPMDMNTATSGLSDTMSPGDISSLSLSNAVAFRVKFDGAVPAPQYRYWRGLVLHRFNGRTWSGNEPRIGRRAREQVSISGEPTRYAVTLEPTHQQWVFALDMPYSWTLSNVFMAPQQQLARMHPIDQRVAYEVVSYPEYSTGAKMNDFTRSRYMSVPEGSNPRTLEFARAMRESADSDTEFILSVLERFTNEEYYYTLEPPPLGTNPVDRFLFDTQRGFCEHYASAFAVMMRAVGIPSRIVLGYQGGELNPMGDYMIVRQSDAHAWTEVWLEGIGWRRVDPTAAVAPERVNSGISGAMFDGIAAAWGLAIPSLLLHRLTLTWDALNARWNEWVLGYGPDNQNQFMKWLGMDDPDWRKMMLALVSIVIALTLLVSVLLMLRYRSPPRDRAAILYSRFVKKTGIEPAIGETPDAFAVRAAADSPLPADTVHTITASYLDARYGSLDPAELARLEAEVTSLS